MFATIFTVATLALATFAKDVSINTPKEVTQCKGVMLTWQDGKGPYKISVVPAEDPCDDALVELPQTSDTWFKWQNPQLNPGTKVIFAIEDASGDEAWSEEVTIQKGETSTCDATSTSSSSASASSDASATTLVVDVTTTPTPTPDSVSSSSDGPVVNPGAGGALGAAPSGIKGSFVATGAGLVVAIASAFFAL